MTCHREPGCLLVCCSWNWSTTIIILSGAIHQYSLWHSRGGVPSIRLHGDYINNDYKLQNVAVKLDCRPRPPEDSYFTLEELQFQTQVFSDHRSAQEHYFTHTANLMLISSQGAEICFEICIDDGGHSRFISASRLYSNSCEQ